VPRVASLLMGKGSRDRILGDQNSRFSGDQNYSKIVQEIEF
jgi:hypothetical protein